MNSFSIEFSNDDGSGVVIDVDELVAYAYYLRNGEPTGDVWLFNRVPAPDLPPWRGDGEPPFLNAKEFAYGFSEAVAVRDTDFRVMYKPGESTKAAIYLRDKLVAIVWDGGRPGKSIFAKKDSSVALAFTEAASQIPPSWRIS